MSTNLFRADQQLTNETEPSPQLASIVPTDRIEADVPTPVYRSVDDFVGHVIYDGRYLDTFLGNPYGVATALGVVVAPDVVETLRGRDRTAVLADVTARMTKAYGQTGVADQVPADITAGFVFIVGAAIGIIVVVDLCVGEKKAIVTDESPDADLKL